MRATVWAGRNSVEVQSVPDPKILNDRDAIVRGTSPAICGSDLHLYDGYIPTATTKTGQCHVQGYLRPLPDRIRNGDIDPTVIISHHLGSTRRRTATRSSKQAGRLHESCPQPLTHEGGPRCQTSCKD